MRPGIVAVVAVPDVGEVGHAVGQVEEALVVERGDAERLRVRGRVPDLRRDEVVRHRIPRFVHRGS
jgi:hypothetical protein